MKCHICEENKLSREFPSDTITEACNHPPYYCLRCVTNGVHKTGKCPYSGCTQSVPQDSPRLKEFEELLDYMFPPLELHAVDLQTEVKVGSDSTEYEVHVTTLTGDSESFRIHSSLAVADFKKMIADRMNVKMDHQRLVYNEKELQSYKSNGKGYVLGEFGVKSFVTIHMMVLLCAVPENFNHVIFDLSWKYPASGRDFLDASCILFMENNWYTFVDWRATGHLPDQVWHSGDEMDDKMQTGHHRIEAKLKNIPKCVSHIVFFLSSFRSPSISKFPQPKLDFYEASDTGKARSLDHFEVTYTHEHNCEALIVCCVSRTEDDKWMIYKGGQTLAGNSRNYRPFKAKVEELVKANVFFGKSLARGKTLIYTMSDQESRQFRQRCDRR